jgi:hypothetical protein
MRKLMIAAVAALVVVALPGVAGAAKNYHIMGTGKHTCLDWTDAETHNLKVFMVVDREWVLGFLSGYSEATAGADPINDNVTNTEVFAFIDSYCKRAPADTIAAAANAFAAAYAFAAPSAEHR